MPSWREVEGALAKKQVRSGKQISPRGNKQPDAAPRKRKAAGDLAAPTAQGPLLLTRGFSRYFDNSDYQARCVSCIGAIAELLVCKKTSWGEVLLCRLCYSDAAGRSFASLDALQRAVFNGVSGT